MQNEAGETVDLYIPRKWYVQLSNIPLCVLQVKAFTHFELLFSIGKDTFLILIDQKV